MEEVKYKRAKEKQKTGEENLNESRRKKGTRNQIKQNMKKNGMW